MGKTYIDTIKYIIYADFFVDGIVEKPDIVGAIFGQTEGLLGDELDLRDLQKNGRVGRIDVDVGTVEGKTKGVIKIPSSLDMVETSIIAASLEIVDRVGPCEASIKIKKIEDSRNLKRKVLLERAKGLLKTLLTSELPETRELTEMVRTEVKESEISEYGPERLSAGPAIDRHDSIILVEGRADVSTLLKNDITNVVEIGGATVPKTIVDLCKRKEVTAFLDGDRGGDIILNNLADSAEIDYVARAPPGKEVEELTRKEIIKALRNRVPFQQGEEEKSATQKPLPQYYKDTRDMRKRRAVYIPKEMLRDSLMKEAEALANTLRARFYSRSGEMVREVQVRDVIKALEETEQVYAVVFDGIITQRLVDLAENRGVLLLIGEKLGNVTKKPENLEVVTKE